MEKERERKKEGRREEEREGREGGRERERKRETYHPAGIPKVSNLHLYWFPQRTPLSKNFFIFPSLPLFFFFPLV